VDSLLLVNTTVEGEMVRNVNSVLIKD